VLAAGKTVQNQAFIECGWKFSEATLNAFVVAHTLKGITQRSRPHTGKEYGFWEGGNSFPSGHATVAWSLAAATSKHFEEEKWVPWIVYPLAGAVSFSRVSSGNHFASDAVIGSALGYLIGKYVVH
jgi:membrane-associated phospholipid phosphatase